MAEVVCIEQALEDLEGAQVYIAEDSFRTAQLVARRVVDATRRLRDFPHSWRLLPEDETRLIRKVIAYKFWFQHQVVGDEVWILSSFHGARLSRD